VPDSQIDFETQLPEYDYEHVFANNASRDGTQTSVTSSLKPPAPFAETCLDRKDLPPDGAAIVEVLTP